MMKRILFIERASLWSGMLCLTLALCLTTSCHEREEEEVLDITGSWTLVDLYEAGTRAVSIGSYDIDVTLVLTAGTTLTEGTFDLSQTVGEGRARTFSGTWTLVETTLSGNYSDGTPWGLSYEVSLSDDKSQLTLTSKGEVYVYKKQ